MHNIFIQQEEDKSDPFKLKKFKILEYTNYIYFNLEATDKF